ncbi:hypothetical protein K456DRAFT_754566 [Colletotrichum gloeosporioides 23]|nr:hypothetical protein K456DRAFT_754566 [Colletotrichum gloeosporioides 23]
MGHVPKNALFHPLPKKHDHSRSAYTDILTSSQIRPEERKPHQKQPASLVPKSGTRLASRLPKDPRQGPKYPISVFPPPRAYAPGTSLRSVSTSHQGNKKPKRPDSYTASRSIDDAMTSAPCRGERTFSSSCLHDFELSLFSRSSVRRKKKGKKNRRHCKTSAPQELSSRFSALRRVRASERRAINGRLHKQGRSGNYSALAVTSRAVRMKGRREEAQARSSLV